MVPRLGDSMGCELAWLSTGAAIQAHSYTVRFVIGATLALCCVSIGDEQWSASLATAPEEQCTGAPAPVRWKPAQPERVVETRRNSESYVAIWLIPMQTASAQGA